MEEVSQGQRWEGLQGEHRGAPQGQSESCLKCGRKEALPEPSADSPRGSGEKILQSSEDRDCILPAWEAARGEGPREKGGSPGDFCRSLGERMRQPGGREGQGPRGRTTQLMQVKTDGLRGGSAPALGAQASLREGLRAPLPLAGPPTRPLLPGPGAVMLAAPYTGGSGQRECPAALPGHLGPLRDPHSLQGPGGSPGPAEQELGGSTGLQGAFGRPRVAAEAPRTSKTAWPEPQSRDRAFAGVSAAQQASALQRLLELNREARRRRQRDREQQRLRVRGRARRAGPRGAAVGPLTVASCRSWSASASPGTATAGCTPWNPHRAQLSSHHRQDPQEKAVGPKRPCRGGGRWPCWGATWIALTGVYPALAITSAERADPGAALCWPLRAPGAGGTGGRSAFRPAPGGRRRATTRPTGTAGANAPGKDRAAASPRGQVRGRAGRLVEWWRSLFPDIWNESPLFPRNTQNFQQLLRPPGAAEPGEHCSPFRGPSKSLMNPQGDD